MSSSKRIIKCVTLPSTYRAGAAPYPSDTVTPENKPRQRQQRSATYYLKPSNKEKKRCILTQSRPLTNTPNPTPGTRKGHHDAARAGARGGHKEDGIFFYCVPFPVACMLSNVYVVVGAVCGRERHQDMLTSNRIERQKTAHYLANPNPKLQL